MRVKSLGEQLLISDWIINRSILPTDVSAAAKKRLVESWLDPGLLNSLRPYCEYLFMNRYIRWISSPPFRRENEKQNGCVFETRWNFQRRKNIFKRGSSSSVVWKLSFFFFFFSSSPETCAQQITRTRSFPVGIHPSHTFHALNSRPIVTEGDALMESAPGKEGNFREVNSSSENTWKGYDIIYASLDSFESLKNFSHFLFFYIPIFHASFIYIGLATK